MASILLIGCGNMGYAMLEGWLHQDPTLNVHAVEPFRDFRERAGAVGAKVYATLNDLPDDLNPLLVVLAVKPNMISPVLDTCKPMAWTGATYVSVAAGITIGEMKQALPQGAATIRCMPNTPASIGEGMMVLCAGDSVSDEARAMTEKLLSASGAVAWVEDENLMDAVTAISGSGPAYVFHFIEALAKAGIDLGLPSQTALLLARQTVAGAGRMALVSSSTPAVLREQVTSPGGTTEAALKVFMEDDRLVSLVASAAIAARDRGAELGHANQNQTVGKEHK